MQLNGYSKADLWPRESNRCQHLRYGKLFCMAPCIYTWSNLRSFSLKSELFENLTPCALTFHKLSCISKTKYRMIFPWLSFLFLVNKRSTWLCILRLLVHFQHFLIRMWPRPRWHRKNTMGQYLILGTSNYIY